MHLFISLIVLMFYVFITLLMRGNVLHSIFIYHPFNSLIGFKYEMLLANIHFIIFIYAFYLNENDAFNIPKTYMYYFGFFSIFA